VAVTNAITLQSVNGASVTIILGGNSNRCVYLASGALLSGFTLTNGAAATGGGLFCASTNVFIFNCLVIGNSAGSAGGVYSGTLSNCTLTGNAAGFGGTGGGAWNSVLNNCTLNGNIVPWTGGNGGGASGSILNNCTLSGNVTGKTYPNTTGSTWGGGAAGCTLNNCTLTGNKVYGAGAHGGGAISCTLSNCVLSGGYADQFGAGAYNCTLTNCTIANNSASYGGGGVSGGTLYNCVLYGNSAGYGGGVYWTTTLNNCTVVGNYAGYGGGGDSCTFNNCIVYSNSGGDAYYCTCNFTCAADAPAGSGNITSPPQFMNQAGNDFHLQSGSPCINAGTNGYVATLSDRDSNLRIANGRVDMGAFEYQQPNPMTVSIQANYTNVVVGIPVSFTGLFSRGAADSWNFGDGTVISNQIFVAHIWSSTGDYPVMLTVFDSSNPGGVSATFTLHVIPPPVSYVDPASANPVPPFSS